MQRPRSSVNPASIVVALGVAVGLFALAFSNGAYDVVTRQTGALVVWWLIGLGAVAVSPAPRRPGTAGLAVTLFAFLIAAWIAMNIGNSISQERTVVELGRAVMHLGPVVLIGWVLPRSLWKSVFSGLLLGGVAVCCVSLGFRLSPGFLGLESAVVFENTRARLAAPLGYWNAVGSWSVITSLLLLAVSSHATRAPVRAVALAAVPIATTVGYLTYSRSAIGAITLGLIVLVAFALNRWTVALHALAAGAATGATVLAARGAPDIANATGGAGGARVLLTIVIAAFALAAVAAATGRLGADRLRLPPRPARAVLGVTVVAAVVAAGIVGSSYGPGAWDQFKENENSTGANAAERLTSLRGSRISQWESALDTYRAEKVHGSGAGTFELSYSTSTDTVEFVRDAHNAFIEALSEQGLVGLLLLIGLLGSIAAAAVTAARRAEGAIERGLVAGASAAIAAFTLGTAIDWFWEVTALATLVMALAGVLIAAGGRVREEGTGESRQTGAWLLRGALLVVAVLAVLIELPGLVGTSEIRRSGQDVAAGDLGAARSHANTAIDTMPWASSPFLQRGLVDEQAGEWTSARRALRLAIERDPNDWRLPLVLARIEARSGRPKQALEAFRQGKALRRGGRFFQ